jgi:hypothetical protein
MGRAKQAYEDAKRKADALNEEEARARRDRLVSDMVLDQLAFDVLTEAGRRLVEDVRAVTNRTLVAIVRKLTWENEFVLQLQLQIGHGTPWRRSVPTYNMFVIFREGCFLRWPIHKAPKRGVPMSQQRDLLAFASGAMVAKSFVELCDIVGFWMAKPEVEWVYGVSFFGTPIVFGEHQLGETFSRSEVLLKRVPQRILFFVFVCLMLPLMLLIIVGVLK